jgi:hypothetical protein
MAVARPDAKVRSTMHTAYILNFAMRCGGKNALPARP